MQSDHDRRQLFVALEESLGHGPAGTLMELLPSVGWADVARQSDLVAVRGEMAEIRGEMGEIRGEMAVVRGEMAQIRGELKGDIGVLRGEVAELRSEVRAQVPRIIAANIPIMFGVAGLVLAAVKLA